MIDSLSNDWLMNNSAFWVKSGETKQTFFQFKDYEFKRTAYNQVAGNLISQRIDRTIQTNWDLDFNIKDFVLIGYEKYIIADMPSFQKINPLGNYDKLITLRLVKVAN